MPARGGRATCVSRATATAQFIAERELPSRRRRGRQCRGRRWHFCCPAESRERAAAAQDPTVSDAESSLTHTHTHSHGPNRSILSRTAEANPTGRPRGDDGPPTRGGPGAIECRWTNRGGRKTSDEPRPA